MTDSSPLVDGLLMIHKVITRGLSVSLKKCDEYLGNPEILKGELQGITMYVTTLKFVTHAHHLSEDEIAFPYFFNKLPAPFERLTNDHKTISVILDKIDAPLRELSAGLVGDLRDVLAEFNSLWIQHIAIEEENFTTGKVQALAGIKEQAMLVQKLSEHGRKNNGPAPLSLAFLFYNLEGDTRRVFMKQMPWILSKVLVPVVWKSQWKPMETFLLPN